MTERTLDVVESEAFVEKYDIKFSPSGMATNEEDAVKIANELGYPVVMKVVSSDIVHKTEVKGVRMWIDDDFEVKKAYQKITHSVMSRFPEAKIKGMQIQKQMGGYEIIVGGKRDPQFGPVVMFGLGGVFVEVLEDVSLRVAPVSKRDIKEMIQEIKGYPTLTGLRGKKAANMDAIEEVIQKISDLMVKEENVVELDLNPMFADCRGVTGADARVVLK